MPSDGSRRRDGESRLPGEAVPPEQQEGLRYGGDAIGLPTRVSEARPGQIGPYDLVEQLGQGGMAMVYRARHRAAGQFPRDVVLKAMLPALAQHPAIVEMFEDEARLTAQLRHPNIVRVESYGVSGATPYLIMEFLDGKNLSQLRGALNRLERRIPIGVAVSVARDLCLALGYAHAFVDARGERIQVIHRDVSPSNVMVQRDGSVKLLDFGVAKLSSAAGQAVTTSLKGKFAYMAPEQVNQEPIDRRCDVFATGIVLHELLTGKRLFGAKTELETLQRVSTAKAQPPSLFNPEVPADLDAVVMRALSLRPEHRYDSGQMMAEALEGLRLAAGRRELAQVVSELFPLEPVRRAPGKEPLLSLGEAYAPDIEIGAYGDPDEADLAAFDTTDPRHHSMPGPGTNPSSEIDLGDNPSAAIWSAGAESLGGGLDTSAGPMEEVRPTSVYHVDVAQEVVPTRVHMPLEAITAAPPASLDARRLFEQSEPTAPQSGNAPLSPPPSNAFLEESPETTVPHQQPPPPPRVMMRVLMGLLVVVLLVGVGFVAYLISARQARVGKATPLPKPTPSASRPAPREPAEPSPPPPELAPPAEDNAASLVGLGERSRARLPAEPEAREPATRETRPATSRSRSAGSSSGSSSSSSSRRRTRSVNEGRIVDPFEGE